MSAADALGQQPRARRAQGSKAAAEGEEGACHQGDHREAVEEGSGQEGAARRRRQEGTAKKAPAKKAGTRRRLR